MRRYARMLTIAAMGLVGLASAMALGAGSNDLQLCALERTSEVREAGSTGKCAAEEVAMTISDEAFESARGRTLTINGVAFTRGSGRTITINGTAFRRGSGNTITINGTAFRRGGGNTITINGTAFRRGGANVLTINGNTFERGSGNTLTINGTAFRTGTLPAGPVGPAGPEGKQGPPGAVPAGPAPVAVDGPIDAANGETKKLTSVSFTSTQPRRILLAGGFNANCASCAGPLTPSWELRLDGASTALVERKISVLESGQDAGASIGEVITTDVCGPCTYNLSLVVPPSSGGASSDRVAATAIRLGVVDLGPVAP